jgi:hypothetical protein
MTKPERDSRSDTVDVDELLEDHKREDTDITPPAVDAVANSTAGAVENTISPSSPPPPTTIQIPTMNVDTSTLITEHKAQINSIITALQDIERECEIPINMELLVTTKAKEMLQMLENEGMDELYPHAVPGLFVDYWEMHSRILDQTDEEAKLTILQDAANRVQTLMEMNGYSVVYPEGKWLHYKDNTFQVVQSGRNRENITRVQRPFLYHDSDKSPMVSALIELD